MELIFDELQTGNLFRYDGSVFQVVRVAEYFDEPCKGMAVNIRTDEQREFRGSEIVEFIGR